MISTLQQSQHELIAMVGSLRKQVCRLEMKTLGVPTSNDFASKLSIQPELLLDLDSTLSQEGLPIATCVQLNVFEMKLKEDSKYREKLVSGFYVMC